MNNFSIERFFRLVAIAVLVVLLAYRVVLAFSFQPEMSVGETNNVWNVLKVLSGKPVYTNPEQAPYEIFQYTPLSQYPVIAASKLISNNGPYFVYKIFICGRLLNLLYNLLMLGILYRIMTKHLHINTTLALVGIAAVFSVLTQLSYAIRPDSLSHLLITAALYFFINHLQLQNIRQLLLSAVFSAVCFFVKQDAVAVAAPIGVWLLVNFKWKKLILFSAFFTLTFLLLLGIFQLIYGPVFIQSITGGVNTGLTLMRGYWVYDRFMGIYNFLPGIATLGILTVLAYFKKQSIEFLIGLCAVFFLLAAIFISFKEGSWINFYVPFLIFGTICLLVLVKELLLISHNISLLLANGILFLLIVFVPTDQLFRRTFVYTAPHLKLTSAKEHYLHCYKIAQAAIQVTPEGKIFTNVPLIKLFLNAQSIFPNTEFYGVSKFDYSSFTENPNKQSIIKTIILDSGEKISSNSTLRKFTININAFYEYKKLYGYTIYTLTHEHL